MGFRALGLDTYPVTSVEEAQGNRSTELAKTRLCGDLPDGDAGTRIWSDVLERYKDRASACHHPHSRPGGLFWNWHGQHPERH